MNAPDKDFDLERDIAEGVFERANLMSIARGDGEIVAGIVTDSAGNIFVGGDRSHPGFLRSLTEVVCTWIDAKGEDI
jgi:hypothetical protein